MREGYYQTKPGIDYCIQRARAYAEYADLIWMETKIPSIPDAKKFSDGMCIFISQYFQMLQKLFLTSKLTFIFYVCH